MRTCLCLGAAGLLLALLTGAQPAGADDDGPKRERAALERVLAALEAHPPETADDYLVAIRELSLVGDSARGYLRSLVRRYVSGPGLDDDTAHAFLGDRRFHHPVPEEITFRGHAFVEAVEEANAVEWFRAEDHSGWGVAQVALGQMRRHHQRLREDHRYRAGDQVFANVAMDARYADQELEFTWADPYAVVRVGPSAQDLDVEKEVDILRRTYRSFLAKYGEHFGLRDLMGPWGGRPDERRTHRSFPDGAPLTVFLYTDRKRFETLALRAVSGRIPNAARVLEVWFSPAGALHVADTAHLGEAAVAQMLRWFARQESRWQQVQAGRDAMSDGFAQWFSARVQGPKADQHRRTEAQNLAKAFAERDRAYPVFPLEKLLSLTTDAEIANYASSKWQVPAMLGIRLFRDQAWALVRMLQGEAYRASFLTYIAAWLRREAQFGMNVRVFEKAFGLRRDDGDWARLDAAWRDYVGALLEIAPGESSEPAAAKKARLRIELARYGDGNESGTRILVWHDEWERLARPVICLPHAPDAQPSERLRPLFEALDALPRGADGTRPTVLLRHRPQKGDRAPYEDVRLVLLALLTAGYEDITLDDSISQEVWNLLEAWRGTGAPGGG